jgi:hypothetical protein
MTQVSYTHETIVREPMNLYELSQNVGRPVGAGLYADWTLLDYRADNAVDHNGTGHEYGILLAVRPHRYHPFVTIRFYWRHGSLCCDSGHYLATLEEAVADLASRPL